MIQYGRSANDVQKGRDYIWDAAFYNGKYYIYFGILPALILLIPYYMVTGEYMLSSLAILIFSVLTIISMKELIKSIFKRYFNDVPFNLMVYSLIILLFGSQILVINGRPKFYELAVISGLFFAITGIVFLFNALEDEKIKYRYLFGSSLFLSLSVACRPTMLLTSFIAMPYFIKIAINSIKKRKDIFKTFCVIGIPYLIIGGLLMYYNYIRFNSIFEFGASYQLTVNDMSHLKNRLATIWTGIMCNLFGIPKFTASFPFVQNNEDIITFYGYYYRESMLGGLSILVPICFFIFTIGKIYIKSERKESFWGALIFIVTGIIMCILSIMMAGSLPRYLADYAWILIIGGIMSFVELRNLYITEEAKMLLDKILKILVIYIVFINLCTGINSEKKYFEAISPEDYYKIKYTVDFWE